MISNSINNQKGLSLISMMVGTIISMLTIAASFVLFQQTSIRANEMNNDMQLEGQMATILLSIQLETQSAGFGIDDAISGNKGALHVPVTADNNEIYWRYNDGSFKCRGFVEVIDTDADIVEMRWLEPDNATDCTIDSEFSSITWITTEVAAQFTQTDVSLISFSESSDSCWPYQQGNSSTKTELTVTGTNSLDVGSDPQFKYCLTNL